MGKPPPDGPSTAARESRTLYPLFNIWQFLELFVEIHMLK